MRLFRLYTVLAVSFFNAQAYAQDHQIQSFYGKDITSMSCTDDANNLSPFEVQSDKIVVPRPMYNEVRSVDADAEYQWKYQSYSECVIQAKNGNLSLEEQLLHLIYKHEAALQWLTSRKHIRFDSCVLSVVGRIEFDIQKLLFDYDIQHLPINILKVDRLNDGSRFDLACSAHEISNPELDKEYLLHYLQGAEEVKATL